MRHITGKWPRLNYPPQDPLRALRSLFELPVDFDELEPVSIVTRRSRGGTGDSA
jgi:hypothetical protein